MSLTLFQIHYKKPATGAVLERFLFRGLVLGLGKRLLDTGTERRGEADIYCVLFAFGAAQATRNTIPARARAL